MTSPDLLCDMASDMASDMAGESAPDTPPLFNSREWLRYTRHIQLPQIGASGQARLKQSKVLVIGCGGLGSPLLLYLAAAGIGHLTVVDGDSVELTNLQRQIAYTEHDLGQPKALTAQQHLQALNSSIEVQAIDQALTVDTGEALVKGHDLIIDCTDNFATRYLINDLCVQWQKPWIFASVYQFSGQCALFVSGGACFRCLFPEPPRDVPDCNAGGVLGVLPGMVGTLQANEAIKYLVGLPTPLSDNLLLVEALDLEFRRIQLQSNPDCMACGKPKQPEQLSYAYEASCGAEISTDTDEPLLVSPEQFNQDRDDGATLILDVRSDEERRAFHIGGDHLAPGKLSKLAELDEATTYFPGEVKIICYCQSGQRSLEAAQQLCNAGLKAYSLAGGLAAWLHHQQTL
ncbi:MAG: HesA/MoeB/ThiF family protein [Porticoccaceae bacterium]|nr:HesA/MoeB/ThiF family protein [Porticoccaceae bacterium]